MAGAAGARPTRPRPRRRSPLVGPRPPSPTPPFPAAARHEVIRAGGASNTPQLLMLSGIGAPDHLADYGIPVVSALRGVGRTLQDRYEIGVVNRARRTWKALRGASYSTDDRLYRL